RPSTISCRDAQSKNLSGKKAAMKRELISAVGVVHQHQSDRGISRRDLLRSAAVLGAGAVLPAIGSTTASAAQVGSSDSASKSGRIDIHSHMTPPLLLQTVGAEALGGFAKWTPEQALAAMDQSGVSTGILSVPPHYD